MPAWSRGYRQGPEGGETRPRGCHVGPHRWPPLAIETILRLVQPSFPEPPVAFEPTTHRLQAVRPAPLCSRAQALRPRGLGAPLQPQLLGGQLILFTRWVPRPPPQRTAHFSPGRLTRWWRGPPTLAWYPMRQRPAEPLCRTLTAEGFDGGTSDKEQFK
jgi:hypothetical protein